MPRELVYLAHPVSGDVDGNVKSALKWLGWIRKSEPSVAIIAPWIAGILAGEDDSDPEQRRRGLLDCETSAARCDGIVLVGGRISNGMRLELDAVLAAGGWVSDLTRLGHRVPAWASGSNILDFGCDEWGRSCPEPLHRRKRS